MKYVLRNTDFCLHSGKAGWVNGVRDVYGSAAVCVRRGCVYMCVMGLFLLRGGNSWQMSGQYIDG